MFSTFKTMFVAICTVGALGVIAYIVVHASLYSTGDDTTVAVPMTQQSVHAATLPIIGPTESPDRLIIPTISIDAAIQHVGLGKTGNMAVPTNYTDVGWYRLGTVPGQIGSAVIDGHVDNGFGLNAVFKHLSDIHIGDDIYIQTQDGSRLHFKVQETDTYAYTDVPLQKIFTQNDTARLTLITCSGSWEGDKDMYDQRLVVYAVLVS